LYWQDEAEDVTAGSAQEPSTQLVRPLEVHEERPSRKTIHAQAVRTNSLLQAIAKRENMGEETFKSLVDRVAERLGPEEFDAVTGRAHLFSILFACAAAGCNLENIVFRKRGAHLWEAGYASEGGPFVSIHALRKVISDVDEIARAGNETQPGADGHAMAFGIPLAGIWSSIHALGEIVIQEMPGRPNWFLLVGQGIGIRVLILPLGPPTVFGRLDVRKFYKKFRYPVDAELWLFWLRLILALGRIMIIIEIVTIVFVERLIAIVAPMPERYVKVEPLIWLPLEPLQPPPYYSFWLLGLRWRKPVLLPQPHGKYPRTYPLLAQSFRKIIFYSEEFKITPLKDIKRIPLTHLRIKTRTPSATIDFYASRLTSMLLRAWRGQDGYTQTSLDNEFNEVFFI
jgi:hypothetical protein